MKKIFVLLFSLVAGYSLLVSAPPALAVIKNPLLNNAERQATAPGTYINDVLQVVISIFFMVAIVYFIWHLVFAGYHLIASEGDPKRWETGKNEITYAVIGLFVVFSVFAIIKMVGWVFGITGLQGLNLTLPTL